MKLKVQKYVHHSEEAKAAAAADSFPSLFLWTSRSRTTQEKKRYEFLPSTFTLKEIE
jgi:hypothetical protein